MRRYWALSILLHLLVLVSFINRRPAIIDDPIVSVSVDFNDAQKVAAPRASAPAKEVNQPAEKNMNSFQEKVAGEESANSESNQTAFETGNVTVKPKVMKQIEVAYPQQAKEARIEGAVRLSVVIDQTGKVSEVTVLEGPGYGLQEAAQEALKQFLFSPAELRGQKVPVRIVYVYRFKLESR